MVYFLGFSVLTLLLAAVYVDRKAVFMLERKNDK